MNILELWADFYVGLINRGTKTYEEVISYRPDLKELIDERL